MRAVLELEISSLAILAAHLRLPSAHHPMHFRLPLHGEEHAYGQT